MHPITERCIFKDVDGLEESHIIIFEGDLMPYGAATNVDAVNDISMLVIQSKLGGVPLRNMSTRFGRLLGKLLKYLPFISIAVVAIMLILLYYGGYIG